MACGAVSILSFLFFLVSHLLALALTTFHKTYPLWPRRRRAGILLPKKEAAPFFVLLQIL